MDKIRVEFDVTGEEGELSRKEARLWSVSERLYAPRPPKVFKSFKPNGDRETARRVRQAEQVKARRAIRAERKAEWERFVADFRTFSPFGSAFDITALLDGKVI